MKRTVNGVLAYGKMIGTALPEKTASYTPISHASVINRVRSEITTAGYVITGEDYRCSNDGEVALGTFKMNYKADPDIELSANFMNSYNKQFAFRFNLGGMVKVCMNGMMLNNNKFGSYRRVHTGAADLLAEGKISEFINDSGEYWESLVKHKDCMKSLIIDEEAFIILGKLFFEKKILTTFQMNTIRKEWAKPSFDYKVHPNSAWALYNHVTVALKDSHPSSWIDDQLTCHEIFSQVLELPVEECEGEVESTDFVDESFADWVEASDHFVASTDAVDSESITVTITDKTTGETSTLKMPAAAADMIVDMNDIITHYDKSSTDIVEIDDSEVGDYSDDED